MNNKSHNYNFSDARSLRIRAEERIEERNEAPTREIDAKKLLHELQVHQVELELQNEELQQAYEIAEEALRKYTLLYDFAPTGYITLNSDAIIREMNFTCAEILGDKRHKLLNKNFREFLENKSAAAFNDFLAKISSGKTKENCILTFADQNLSQIYIEGSVIGNDLCLLSLFNLSTLQNVNNP